jgi:hypothetical protein
MKLHYHIKGKDIPIYKGKLYIVVSNDYEKVEKLIPGFDKWSNGELYAHSFLVNHKGEEGIFIILNFDNEFDRMTYGTIVHEIRHAYDLVAQRRGLNTTPQNTENNAYIEGWIANTVFLELIRWGFVPQFSRRRKR